LTKVVSHAHEVVDHWSVSAHGPPWTRLAHDYYGARVLTVAVGGGGEGGGRGGHHRRQIQRQPWMPVEVMFSSEEGKWKWESGTVEGGRLWVAFIGPEQCEDVEARRWFCGRRW
jgi:hypothetical protein